MIFIFSYYIVFHIILYFYTYTYFLRTYQTTLVYVMQTID